VKREIATVATEWKSERPGTSIWATRRKSCSAGSGATALQRSRGFRSHALVGLKDEPAFKRATTTAHAVSPPASRRFEVVVHLDSNDIACGCGIDCHVLSHCEGGLRKLCCLSDLITLQPKSACPPPLLRFDSIRTHMMGARGGAPCAHPGNPAARPLGRSRRRRRFEVVHCHRQSALRGPARCEPRFPDPR
jgi:hypothetical protein